jgi:hypothetical protein
MSLAYGTTGTSSVTQDVEVSLVKEIEKDGDDGERSMSEPEGINEKGNVVDISNRGDDWTEEAVLLSHEEQFPVDPSAPEETQQLTFRAMFVGCVLGGVRGKP